MREDREDREGTDLAGINNDTRTVNKGLWSAEKPPKLGLGIGLLTIGDCGMGKNALVEAMLLSIEHKTVLIPLNQELMLVMQATNQMESKTPIIQESVIQADF
jgi:hypothetical protein